MIRLLRLFHPLDTDYFLSYMSTHFSYKTGSNDGENYFLAAYISYNFLGNDNS